MILNVVQINTVDIHAISTNTYSLTASKSNNEEIDVLMNVSEVQYFMNAGISKIN